MGVTWRNHPSPADRRTAARRQATLGTVCQLTGADGAELGVGLVWNLSARGISLLMAQRLEPGTTVQAKLLGPGGVTTTRGMCVAHAAELETGDFALGGQFDQDLTVAEMNPFLAP